MPSFIHKTTGEVVEAVRLNKPLATTTGLPNKDIENSAWAGDWFVSGKEEQGWLTDKEMSENFKAAFLPHAVPLGAVIIDESGQAIGEMNAMFPDPSGREILIKF